MRVRSSSSARVALGVLAAGVTAAAVACGNGSGPTSSATVALRLELPDSATVGQPFQLTVTAHGRDPSTPLASFSERVQLAVSSGTITPSAVQLSAGEGSVQAQIANAEGDVTVTATYGSVQAAAVLPINACRVQPSGLGLYSQAHVDAAAGICEVEGLVLIQDREEGDPILSLAPLTSLRRADLLWVHGTTHLADLTGLTNLLVGGVSISENARLANLHDLAVATPGSAGIDMATVLVANNPVLGHIASLAYLLESNEVTGGVHIANNPALASLTGLERIRIIGGNLVVRDNGSLLSLDGLAGLEEVEYIEVSGNGIEHIDLRGLRKIRGDVDIIRNFDLETIRLGTNSVGEALLGGINIQQNRAVEAIEISVSNGKPHLRITDETALTRLNVQVGSREADVVAINGIDGTGLTTIEAFDIISAGTLWISNNTNLSDIGAFQNLASVVNDLRILNNPVLCVPSWASSVSVGGSRVMTGNRTDCDD